LKTAQSVEQLRQVNEALIAMGKPPLTKQEAALILGTAHAHLLWPRLLIAGSWWSWWSWWAAGEKKRRETLVLPKGVGAAINSAAQSSPNGQVRRTRTRHRTRTHD